MEKVSFKIIVILDEDEDEDDQTCDRGLGWSDLDGESWVWTRLLGCRGSWGQAASAGHCHHDMGSDDNDNNNNNKDNDNENNNDNDNGNNNHDEN